MFTESVSNQTSSDCMPHAIFLEILCEALGDLAVDHMFLHLENAWEVRSVQRIFYSSYPQEDSLPVVPVGALDFSLGLWASKPCSNP